MKMSVGGVVGCKFTCEIGRRKATFEIWGGESRSPNRGVKGSCVDASGVEVHEGISDCLSGFQPRRFSPILLRYGLIKPWTYQSKGQLSAPPSAIVHIE